MLHQPKHNLIPKLNLYSKMLHCNPDKPQSEHSIPSTEQQTWIHALSDLTDENNVKALALTQARFIGLAIIWQANTSSCCSVLVEQSRSGPPAQLLPTATKAYHQHQNQLDLVTLLYCTTRHTVE